MSLTEIAADISRQRDAYVEEILTKIPPGTRVCVHDIEFTLEEPKFDQDTVKMRYEINAHILPGTSTCETQVRRTEYTR